MTSFCEQKVEGDVKMSKDLGFQQETLLHINTLCKKKIDMNTTKDIAYFSVFTTDLAILHFRAQ